MYADPLIEVDSVDAEGIDELYDMKGWNKEYLSILLELFKKIGANDDLAALIIDSSFSGKTEMAAISIGNDGAYCSDFNLANYEPIGVTIIQPKGFMGFFKIAKKTEPTTGEAMYTFRLMINRELHEKTASAKDLDAALSSIAEIILLNTHVPRGSC
jgi:hypothetical protein